MLVFCRSRGALALSKAGLPIEIYENNKWTMDGCHSEFKYKAIESTRIKAISGYAKHPFKFTVA